MNGDFEKSIGVGTTKDYVVNPFRFRVQFRVWEPLRWDQLGHVPVVQQPVRLQRFRQVLLTGLSV